MSKYFFAIGIMVIMMSCGKDVDQFVPRASQGEIGDIDNLISRLQTDIAGDIKTSISCPCSGGKVFEIDKDIVLVVPPDFIDLSIYPCINGYFDIEVTVCDTKGEVLISGIPTISESKLLESRIELNIDIKYGSSEVKLAHGKQLRILVNDPDPRERMELFYGGDQEWIQADRNIDTWDNVFNSEWFFQDSSQEVISGFGYECFSDSLDWINVDVFVEVPSDQKTSACIQLPDEFTNTNTMVFMVFDDYKSILAMHGDAETRQFCEPYGASPIGYNVTFVVIADMGNDLFLFDSRKANLKAGHNEVMSPRKTPYDEIKNYILAL